jgi:DNA adenine methylase
MEKEIKVKSPLRYPGGKSRAVRHILPYFPTGIKKMASPFCGGASVEVTLSNSGVYVHCYDTFEDLIVFWQVLQKSPIALSDKVKSYYPLSRTRFYELQKESPKDELEQAAIFYVLNRSSFSGITKSGGMSPGHPRFTEKGIDSLKNFNFNGSFEHATFSESISKHKSDFMYLDPPYKIVSDNLYGVKGNHHKNFNHDELREMVEDCQSWVMSYNDCPEIRKMYEKYRIVELAWAYGMGNSKKSNEILIIKD